jgi:hypothetical protein
MHCRVPSNIGTPNSLAACVRNEIRRRAPRNQSETSCGCFDSYYRYFLLRSNRPPIATALG